MIFINRRLKVLEAMNWCERRGAPYQVQWGFAGQYQVIVEDDIEQQLAEHLSRWEKS